MEMAVNVVKSTKKKYITYSANLIFNCVAANVQLFSVPKPNNTIAQNCQSCIATIFHIALNF